VFLREAEAAVKVASPYVVTLVDWGDSPPFIAYEYMAGGTLKREIERRQQASEPWSLTELLGLFRHLAEGMSAINVEVIHRDLKPENIYLDAGTPRISDFGISRYVGNVTRTLSFKGWGTALYMAPETFRLDSVDWTADQYSLGVVFYELATLERLFAGDWDALKQAHLYQAPPPINTKRSDFPLRLSRLVSRMLEKQPSKRFGSWREIIDELSSLSEANNDEEAPSPATSALAQRAAAALHADQTEQLAQQQAADQQKAWEQERDRLLAYWAEQFFKKIRERVAALNRQLGQEAYTLTTIDNQRRDPRRLLTSGHPRNEPNRCEVRFFNGELAVELQPAPYQNERAAWGWGSVTLTTYHRGWYSNLILLPEPEPYGTWNQIDMQISGLMRQGAEPENRRRGRYKIIRDSRVVLGEDWNFLMGEWDYRSTTSVVDYSEKALDFDSVLNDLFDILTDDGPRPKPEPPRRRGPLDDLRWPDV
jgi:serine/threonine protein kinase